MSKVFELTVLGYEEGSMVEVGFTLSARIREDGVAEFTAGHKDIWAERVATATAQWYIELAERNLFLADSETIKLVGAWMIVGGNRRKMVAVDIFHTPIKWGDWYGVAFDALEKVARKHS